MIFISINYGGNIVENKLTWIKKYKSKSKIEKINNVIIGITISTMIAWMLLMFVNMGTNNLSIISPWIELDILLILIMGSMALAGVLSVVASNNKSPIKLLILSIIATLYKLLYPISQLVTGQEGVNSTVILGQLWSLFAIIIQVFFWIKWNKETDEGKFITQVLKGRRSTIAFIIISLIFVFQVTISILLNRGNLLFTLMDVLGGMLYTIAATLMAFGNILCFIFFLLSDANWLYWTITDLTTSNNGLMLAMALTTMIQVLAYILLVFTGFLQWFQDDFKIIDKKIVRKIR